MLCFLLFQCFQRKKDSIEINVQYLQCFRLNFHDKENKAFKGVTGIQITVAIEMRGKILHQ